MRFRDLNEQDIQTVIGDMSRLDRCEMVALGNDEIDLECRFWHMIGLPFCVSITDDDGEAQAIFSLLPVGETTWRAYFVAREGCFRKIGREMTMFFRRFAYDFVWNVMGEIEVVSPWASDEIVSWFAFMGFRQEPTGSDIIRFVKGRY